MLNVSAFTSFFLIHITFAGIIGTNSTKKIKFYIQSIPALITLVSLIFS
ncbi:DUF1304 family protein [Gelidibacter sp.]|nr:DUF1304 family protein [Gelidibacter sp.]